MDLLTPPSAPGHPQSRIFFRGIVFPEVDLPGKRKKIKKFHTWFLDFPRLHVHPPTHRPEFFFAESFSPRSIYPESEKKFKKFSKIFFLPPHPYQYEDHLEPSMPHIRGIKTPMGSNEVPIDREHPGAHPVNFPHIAIHLYGRGWPSK